MCRIPEESSWKPEYRKDFEKCIALHHGERNVCCHGCEEGSEGDSCPIRCGNTNDNGDLALMRFCDGDTVTLAMAIASEESIGDAIGEEIEGEE
jgi:hypothetical protein